MKKSLSRLLLALLTIFCAWPPMLAEAKVITEQAIFSAAVEGNNALACGLYSHLAKESENLFFGSL